nr:heme-binding domain-containing protein [Elizabethkingia bruuniana]
MRKLNIIGWLSVIVVAVVLAIYFIPVERNVSTVPAGQSFEKTEKVPANVAAILKVSCYDCHSNNTRYPWYSVLQPGAWFMARHIKKAKKNSILMSSITIQKDVKKQNKKHHQPD